MGHKQLLFDPSRVCFSRRNSLLSFVEETGTDVDGRDKIMISLVRGLYYYGGTNPFLKHAIQMRLYPAWGGEIESFRSAASPARLDITGTHSDIRICFDGPDCVRIRCERGCLQAQVSLAPPETLTVYNDQRVRINYMDGAGEFLIVPVDTHSCIRVTQFSAEHRVFLLDFFGADPEQPCEFAIVTGTLGLKAPAGFDAFDACAEASRADWERWDALYPAVSEDFSYIRDLAAYCIWQSNVADKGVIKDSFVLFNKTRNLGGLCWQQVYQAMAITQDVDQAVRTIGSVFQFLDPQGMLPDSVNDVHCQYSVTKPPFQGYGLLHMLDYWGDAFTPAHARQLYPNLCRWIGWWLTCRDTDGNGNPEFFNGCETGVDKNEALSGGVPAETPDLMAYVILFEEALAKLAGMIGLQEESLAWKKKSEDLLQVLIHDFWNGHHFIARAVNSDTYVEYEELEGYLPLILGKRLPETITQPLIDRLLDPEMYYTPCGFRTYPKQYIGTRPIPGFIGVFAQFKLFPALIELGKAAEVKDAMKGFLDRNSDKYPNFGIMEFDDPEFVRGGAATTNPGSHITSLGAAIYIYLAWLWDRTYGGAEND